VEAENSCRTALELNPGATDTRYTLGVVYERTGRLEEALAEFEKVLETDELNTEAMQWAGNLSAQLGRDEQAREYYNAFLRLDPGNAPVRMKVAYDLAQAGDPLGAMQIIEVGLAEDPENVDLLKQHGGFAFAAGSEARQGQEEMPQEAVDLFRKALASYDRAYELEGEGMDVAFLTKMVSAYINLDEFPEAVALSERILETHGDQAVVWSYYADALQRSGRLEDAMAALDRVLALDPEYENVGARKGRWLLDQGLVEEAVPHFQEAVARGEQTGEDVCNILFNSGYQNGIRPEDWGYAIEVMRLAKEFEISDEVRQKVDFWLGYAILKAAIIRQEPRTKETAQATLPLFQEARRLFQSASGYAQSQGTLEDDRLALLGSIAQFIEIQEAIIKRGR
jgi:tetratricopeptide (TPR) repeat protein